MNKNYYYMCPAKIGNTEIDYQYILFPSPFGDDKSISLIFNPADPNKAYLLENVEPKSVLLPAKDIKTEIEFCVSPIKNEKIDHMAEQLVSSVKKYARRRDNE